MRVSMFIMTDAMNIGPIVRNKRSKGMQNLLFFRRNLSTNIRISDTAYVDSGFHKICFPFDP